jgi:hypothetical protein
VVLRGDRVHVLTNSVVSDSNSQSHGNSQVIGSHRRVRVDGHLGAAQVYTVTSSTASRRRPDPGRRFDLDVRGNLKHEPGPSRTAQDPSSSVPVDGHRITLKNNVELIGQRSWRPLQVILLYTDLGECERRYRHGWGSARARVRWYDISYMIFNPVLGAGSDVAWRDRGLVFEGVVPEQDGV